VEKTVATVRGQVVVPSKLGRKFGIKKGTQVFIYEKNSEIVIRPITDEYIEGMAGTMGTKGKLLKTLTRQMENGDKPSERRRGKFLFYEFFAGGGMARAGLGKNWRCAFANDCDEKKATSYRANWGGKELRVGDVAELTTADLRGAADLAWASFPCQDLSLAGPGAGLKGERSGTFWPFWKLMRQLKAEGRAPCLVVLENVCGTLSSHEGNDFAAIGGALSNEGYRFGAVVIDAADFLPQSRPRLFIIGVRDDAEIAESLILPGADPKWHPNRLVKAFNMLSVQARAKWAWWALPTPPGRLTALTDLVEDNPKGVRWHTPEETKRLLEMMSDVNLKKVQDAKKAGRRMVGGIYRRTRRDSQGRRTQRAEVRFDDVAGCLRTPVGGSSRQSILVVDGDDVRSRLLSPLEAARLMGLPETYKLPENYNEAYHVAGDGLAVPAVRFLAASLLEPALGSFSRGL
jgi:DNA (cytosine-5)-methyltransferase 1